jgi:predicted ATPase
MLQVVASALGYIAGPGAALDVGIAKFMGARRLLVLLDNCEHLLDPAASLTEIILERCPNVGILATSREPLDVRGERVIRLRSLPVPQPEAPLEQLANFDAAKLFLDRAEATGADPTLGPADGPAISEICRRLDGIPLAIELAAARVIALAPEEIAAHLDERFRLLTGGRRAVVERHHTLRATIDWSYSLLREQDQIVFHHLGVFPASFDASAAEAVAAGGGVEPWDVLDALTSLVARSMLNADRSLEGPTRYQMLESLRHYARERLDAAGAADEARRCHARHYAAAVVEISSGLRGPDEVSWRRRLDADLDNFRAAVNWALDSAPEADGELAMVILGELWSGWSLGRTSVFGGIGDQAVDRVRRSASRYASLVMAGRAHDAYARGEFSRGLELSSEARQGVGVSPYSGLVLGPGFSFLDAPQFEADLSAALLILDEVGAGMSDYAWVHGIAASMAAILGDNRLAQQEAPVAVELSRRVGNPSLLGTALYGFALASWQADPSAAQIALEEQIRIARATGADYMLARSLALLAQLNVRAGDLPAALEALREGLGSAHINSDRPSIAVCLARGMVVMVAVGELETAAVFLGAVTNAVLARSTSVSPNEIPDVDAFVARLRSELGEDRFTAAITRGTMMTYEQAGALALAAVESLRPPDEFLLAD